MGLLTWLCAPWSVRVMYEKRWRLLPQVVLAWWFSVDGSYWLYHTALGNEMLREENLRTSTCMYWFMGLFWLYRGSLRQLHDDVRAAWHAGLRR